MSAPSVEPEFAPDCIDCGKAIMSGFCEACTDARAEEAIVEGRTTEREEQQSAALLVREWVTRRKLLHEDLSPDTIRAFELCIDDLEAP